MSVVMQSLELFDELAELDPASGQVSFHSKMRDPHIGERAPRGVYRRVDGRLACLYRDEAEVLHVRVGPDHVPITSGVEPRFQRGRRHVLELVRRGEILLSWSYAPPPIEPLLHYDLIVNVEEEDHDMGLFIYNVLASPERRALIAGGSK